MSKVKILVGNLLKEGVGMDTTGLGKQIVKKESPVAEAIQKFLKSKFKKTKVHLINATGEVWEINCEAPIDVTDTMTGIEKREIAKVTAYDHKNQLEEFIKDKFNYTPLSIGGIDAQGNTCKFLIQFVMRNLPAKELVEGLLKEAIKRLGTGFKKDDEYPFRLHTHELNFEKFFNGERFPKSIKTKAKVFSKDEIGFKSELDRQKIIKIIEKFK